MTMQDFLRNKYGSEYVQEGPNKGSVRRSNQVELDEYLKEEPNNPDLSEVDFDYLVEIREKKFDSFTANFCDFFGGFMMGDCQIKGDLSFNETYVHNYLGLTETKVGEDFTYPQNLPDLIAEDNPTGIQITGLEVRGTTSFTPI